MSLEKAKKGLEAFGLSDRIKLFDVSSATVALAAQALGVEEGRIAKTLSYSVFNKPVLVVMRGDARVDNRKFKDQFGTKAKMLTPEEAEALIGHAVGGVCPFGINSGVDVYIDNSVKAFDIVYPAAGTSSSAVELTVDELFRASGAISFVDIAKDAE